MSHRPIDPEIQKFVEDMGFSLEHLGLGRMAGRIFGWLLVCEPAEQSAEDLAAALSASKGSISTATRMLLQHQAIERAGRPGERRTYFRLGGMTALRALESDLMAIRGMRPLFDRALGLLRSKAQPQRKEIELYTQMLAFFDRELPKLMERFRHEQEKGR